MEEQLVEKNEWVHVSKFANNKDPVDPKSQGPPPRQLWHSRLWRFQGRDTKLERFLAKINCIQMKLPNFENWSNGELSKSTKI